MRLKVFLNMVASTPDKKCLFFYHFNYLEVLVSSPVISYFRVFNKASRVAQTATGCWYAEKAEGSFCSQKALAAAYGVEQSQRLPESGSGSGPWLCNFEQRLAPNVQCPGFWWKDLFHRPWVKKVRRLHAWLPLAAFLKSPGSHR